MEIDLLNYLLSIRNIIENSKASSVNDYEQIDNDILNIKLILEML